MAKTSPEIELGPVRDWSFSTLTSFEECPYRVYLAKVEKSPRPPVDENSPLERGNRVHKAAELYMQGAVELAPELEDFKDILDALKRHYAAGKVSIEEDWAHNLLLEPVAWRSRDAWLRLKCDVVYHKSKKHVVIVDWKTGRMFGNEVKHAQQGQLYAAIAAERYPDAEKITVEFHYVDQDDITAVDYTRRHCSVFLAKFVERATRMTTCNNFPPKPSSSACRWCDFGTNKGTGRCEYAAS